MTGVEALAAERWRSRPVLVFAGQGHAERLDDQLALLTAEAGGVDERAIVVYVVTPEGVTREGVWLGGGGVSLRERYEIGVDGWAVLLVGKDGGEKLRETEGVLGAERLFGVIDVMPMRRAEMEKRR